jgi:hypothetical protein
VTTLNQSDNIILDLLEPSNSRNNLLIIQITLSSFNNNTQCIFEFYTDGSLINLGTEQCSTSCSFAHLNTEFDVPQVEFATKIDNWPSAYRGELLAVILALCVVRAPIGTVRFGFYQNRYRTETISIGIGINRKKLVQF